MKSQTSVSSLVAGQRTAFAQRTSDAARRMNGLMLELRVRGTQSAITQKRIRAMATDKNCFEVAKAMKAHIDARSSLAVLCDMQLGELYGFNTEKNVLDELVGVTQNRFTEAEALSNAIEKSVDSECTENQEGAKRS